MSPRTILLTLAYDGSAYCGWQVQPNGVAVQAVVEQALAEFTGETIRATAAGRTDAGVHALGQLVSFPTASDIPAVGFRLGLQTKLPDDIVVQDAIEVPNGFSARYDATRKTYRYVIQNAPLRTPWLRNYVGWHRAPLDDRAMQAALDLLIGTHDFRCFETDWPNKATSIRTIFEAKLWRTSAWNVWQSRQEEERQEARGIVEWNRNPSSTPAPPHPRAPTPSAPPSLNPQPSTLNFLALDLTADGFLYNMVRAIVGTLIHVGRGNWTPDDVRRIVASQSRAEAGETAPPEGLYLLRCDYEINLERIAARLAGSKPVGVDGSE